MPEDAPKSMNPAALAIHNTALVLSKAGGRAITEAMLRADLDAGAPTNANGTLNLVHYAAWLAREMASAGGAQHGA